MLLDLFEGVEFPGKKTNVESSFKERYPKISSFPGREVSNFPAPALDSTPILLDAKKQNLSVPVKAEDEEEEAEVASRMAR